MKNQFKLLTLAASAAMMFTACSSDKLEAYAGQPDLNPEAPSNAIQFGTYTGKSGITRAGWEGSINDDALKASDKANGFGVFAYYTGTSTYGQAQRTTYSGETGSGTNIAPNFMYNQKVTYTDPNWVYSPVKYWPNEVQNGAVDDQDNDTGNDPATSTGTNGGNVSFFAYAPYVSVSTSTTGGGTLGREKVATATAGYETDANQKGTQGVGITEITTNATEGDPKITYVLAKDGNVVDLLWGTLDATATGQNVLGTGNTGVTGNNTAADNTYAKAVLDGYTVPADLTKQKVEGKVSLAFKHALAKVGGATMTGTPATVSDNSGLLVQLDIDNNGSEMGGTKDANTVVTIESITIKNLQVEYDSNGDGTAETNGWVTGGVFNLATGKWDSFTTGSEADAVTHTIKRDGVTASATLNSKIAEPESVSGMTKSSGSDDYVINSSITGVLKEKQAVYKEETNPFLFIPGTKPSFEVEVTYIVRTFDDNLANTAPGTGESGTWTKVKQTIKKKVTFNELVQLNKQYTLVMHLGLTSVKFEAKVSDWELDGTDSDTDGDVEENEVDITDVYLPINVQGETTAQTVAAGSNVTVNTAADRTSYNLTITGLNAGNKLTIATSAGSSIGTFTVFQANGTTEITKADESYTVAAGEDTVVISAPMTSNSTASAKVNTLTITEKNLSDETVSTTVVNITQKASVTP